MNTVAEKKEQVIGGTTYHMNTPVGVINALEEARKTATRIRVFYGEHETGRDWMEEHDTIGYVGRSGGNIKIPLLIHSARSLGGAPILDHAIVKIVVAKGGHVLYKHPRYNQPQLFVPYETDVNGLYMVNTEDDNLANFETREKALRWVDFMQGIRNNK